MDSAKWARAFATISLVLVTTVAWAGQSPDEELARRQFESGRSFARQGNFTEAIRDFRVVADTYPNSSVADNALIELARYFLDVASDPKEATTAVEAILKRYPTSDSAPDAYLITGRLAMARSHQTRDLETALASFDRVSRLFPTADAVPQSLVLAGEALWYSGRFDDALASLARVEVEYPNHAMTAQAHVTSARVLVSRGDPVGAMEALQKARNGWPASPEADAALGQLTILHRLHVRARNGGAAYALTAETPGPPRLQNVVGLGATAGGAIFWAAETGFGQLTTQKSTQPVGPRPRGLATDNAGNLVAIETGGLRTFGGTFYALTMPRQNAPPVPLNKIDAAVQLYMGDWLVADEDVRGIQRFSRTGEYLGQFSTTRVTRMALNAMDEIAGLDRDQKGVVLLDATGAVTGRIPPKGTGYDFPNLEGLTFDRFGHLYVLDRASLGIFSPGTATATAKTYTLITVHADPAGNPTAFRRATAFALDLSGGLYLYDDRAERVRVYR